MAEKEQAQRKFESKYEEREKEILVLTADLGVGACSFGMGYWEVRQEFLAYIDIETGELREGKGIITWFAEENDRKIPGWIHNLENETIYRLRVREKRDKTVPEGMIPIIANKMMLVEVIERNLSNLELEEVLKEYRKPVLIEDKEYGTFTLDKKYGWFEHTVKAMGYDIDIHLEVDEYDGVTAEGALMTFHKIFNNIYKWDADIREYVAKMLIEDANEWMSADYDEEDFDEIDEEEFADNIWINSITIKPDGSFEAYYNDNDIFFDHVIIVSGKMEDEVVFKDAYIAG